MSVIHLGIDELGKMLLDVHPLIHDTIDYTVQKPNQNIKRLSHYGQIWINFEWQDT
jgi:hypothetical protein